MRPDFELNQAVSRELTALDQKLSSEVDLVLADREPLLPCVAAVSGTLRKAVDVYNGPSGKGTVLRLIYEQDGQKWIKRVARGPEAYRCCDWELLSIPAPKLSYGTRTN